MLKKLQIPADVGNAVPVAEAAEKVENSTKAAENQILKVVAVGDQKVLVIPEEEKNLETEAVMLKAL